MPLCFLCYCKIIFSTVTFFIFFCCFLSLVLNTLTEMTEFSAFVGTDFLKHSEASIRRYSWMGIDLFLVKSSDLKVLLHLVVRKEHYLIPTEIKAVILCVSIQQLQHLKYRKTLQMSIDEVLVYRCKNQFIGISS